MLAIPIQMTYFYLYRVGFRIIFAATAGVEVGRAIHTTRWAWTDTQTWTDRVRLFFQPMVLKHLASGLFASTMYSLLWPVTVPVSIGLRCILLYLS